MIAIPADRVVDHTADAINERNRLAIRQRVGYYAEHKDQIPERLRRLDAEWDVERALETGSATLTLTGLALGTLVNRKWFLLSAAVQGFFLQHALQGWCPPLPVFRKLGFRTQGEIQAERHALLQLLENAKAAASPDFGASSSDSVARTLPS